MSRLNELQDQLKQKFQEISEKIKETEIYQKLDEKYQSLSPRGQKIARYTSAIVFAFFVLFYPISQLQISGDFVTEFDTKRELLRDMLKTHRESGITNMLPPTSTSEELIQQVNSTLSTAQLLPQQIISVMPGEPQGRLIARNIINNVVSVSLANLNLRQTVDIGTQLANISGSIKVKDLLMKASLEKNGYFDVTYQLYAFNTPKAIIEAAPDAPDVKKKNKPNDDTEMNKNSSSGVDE